MEPTTNGHAPGQMINLGEHQQRILEQITRDEGILAQLQRQAELVAARLQANRGKLDLIAELSEAMAVVTHGTAE